MRTDRTVESRLREWFASHHGVISLYEALRLGASRQMIQTKLARGEWAVMHRSVYRATVVPRTPHQDLRAAYLTTRGVGLASHESAAWLWGLLPSPPAQPTLSIPAHASAGRGIPGLTIHRYADVATARAAIRDTIPVTNPLRTVVDLAGSGQSTLLAETIDAALAKRLFTVAALTAELDRLGRRGRRGAGTLRRHLTQRGFIGTPEPSLLEAKARRLILAAGLPLPTVELRVGENGEYRLDFAWPALYFSVEVDGYLWHFSPEQHQRDLNRRNRLQDAGWTLRVYTWRDLCHEPARVGHEITATYRRLAAATSASAATAATAATAAQMPAAKSSTI